MTESIPLAPARSLFTVPTTDEIADALAAAVLATPGVVRLAPPWHQALRGVTGTSVDAGRALHVRLDAPVVDVSLDIVCAGPPASVVAADAVASIRRTLIEQGLTPGLLTLNVLDIQAVDTVVA